MKLIGIKSGQGCTSTLDRAGILAHILDHKNSQYALTIHTYTHASQSGFRSGRVCERAPHSRTLSVRTAPSPSSSGSEKPTVAPRIFAFHSVRAVTYPKGWIAAARQPQPPPAGRHRNCATELQEKKLSAVKERMVVSELCRKGTCEAGAGATPARPTTATGAG